MSDDWQAAYPVGCRVAVDVEAWTARLCRKSRLRPPYTGTVTGYPFWSQNAQVCIHLDGRVGSNIRRYPVACLRRLVELTTESGSVRTLALGGRR